MSYQKLPEESYVESGIKLKDLFTKWIQPGAKAKKEVCEVIILEQLLDDIPPELKVWMKKKDQKTLKKASEMADNYVAAEKGNKARRVCTNCGKAGHIARFSRVSKAKTDQETGGEKEEVTEAKTVSGKSKKITCFSCGEIGHYASKYPQKLKTDKSSKIEKKDSLFAHSRKASYRLCENPRKWAEPILS
ncbi:uncharacterized protein LOC134178766 [Corticium candelabrum]|uniref:uncharacterized protein LOC134178766 n=1 Tax=Corticium candelabrum TaxID=121492 RepID=UPI002E269856|nr:uncharacterized protein LOC134178766 [Corticium candelabrum]